jgi:hypothetical protein
MPEFVNEAGRRIGAPADSDLARVLARSGYRETVGGKLPAVPVTDSADAEPADELAGLKRGELNELAESLGIDDAAKLKNADAVRDAIRSASD